MGFVYEDDEHANVVLGVLFQDSIVEIDQKLEKSTKLDLVLGNGQGRQIEMPNFIGDSQKNMNRRLQNSSLNMGEFYYDISVVDTPNAFVFKQEPIPQTKGVDLGAFVNLWYTEDSSHLTIDTLELMRQDSLKARLDSILND